MYSIMSLVFFAEIFLFKILHAVVVPFIACPQVLAMLMPHIEVLSHAFIQFSFFSQSM